MSITEYGADITSYHTFNEFFTRRIKAEYRPIKKNTAIVLSPADGVISQIGYAQQGNLLQAKGKIYSLTTLLTEEVISSYFENGAFATIYLSPKDYHRVHMPLTGRLEKMIYVPGRIFSVNSLTAQYVSNLFARNERMIALFSTEAGKMAVVMVGAMIVAGINTVWSGKVTPNREKNVVTVSYDEEIVLQQGEEMGSFCLGSTVIILFEKDCVKWSLVEKEVIFGQPLGAIN